jgi:hypothetical protein
MRLIKEKEMRKYNRLNCDSTVRARFTDSWGRVITLTPSSIPFKASEQLQKHL